MQEKRYVIWQPNPGPQTDFLAAPEEEVGYGGAAGGGKTDGLIIDALGLWQGAIEIGEYRSIIFRRTFPELSQIMERSQELYPTICPGAKYSQTEHEWTFPSGAKVIFAYAESPLDKFRHQGKAYQYIGFEELTQWPTDEIYRYLLSRLRHRNGTESLKCLMRSTFNPGGVGHKWVQKRFSIDDTGSASRQTVTVVVTDDKNVEHNVRLRRRFIPARLSDNPFLGVEYRAQLMQMDEMERKALLDGRWDIIDIPGQIYKSELQLLFNQGRRCTVPVDPAVPVHTIWDLGMSDLMTIWFVQRANMEWHIVDYYESNGAGIAHYVQVLKSKGYTYGTHIAPHDIRVRELGTGLSRLDVAKSLGLNFEVAPNLDREDGINAVRLLLERCWFDAERTDIGFEHLTNYRRDYNKQLGELKAEPVHDSHSHGADGFRMFAVSVNLLVDNNTASGAVVFEGDSGSYELRPLA